MAKYATFKYGTGVKYGGVLGTVNLYKINGNDPSYATTPRHIELDIQYSTSAKWAIDVVRLVYARRQHVLPKWLIPVDRLLKRTEVTLKYSTSEFWAVDSLRLRQRIRHQGPNV